MKRDYKLFIRDIFKAIENTESFIGKMDFNEFYADDKTRSSAVWKIGVIGETTKNIPKNVRDNYKELQWRKWQECETKSAILFWGGI